MIPRSIEDFVAGPFMPMTFSKKVIVPRGKRDESLLRPFDKRLANIVSRNFEFISKLVWMIHIHI